MLANFNPQSMSDDHLLPAALLETGDTLNFIEVRKHALRFKIKESKLSAGVGKVSGLSAIAGGGFLAVALSNPVGQLIAAGGVASYGLAVLAQWMQTGKIHPMPLSSTTSDEMDANLAESTVTGGGQGRSAKASIESDSSYLGDREKVEYNLLHFSPEGLLSAMNHVPPTQRWACYHFLVDAFLAGTIQSYFQNPQALRDVLGTPSLYHSHLPAAADRFPEYGIEAEGAIAGYEVAAPVAAIGATTKFGAIAVEAAPVAATAATIAKASKPLFITQMGYKVRNTLIIGVPGAGKDHAAANLIDEVRLNHPGKFIVGIDPKGSLKESGNWQEGPSGYDKVFRFNLGKLGSAGGLREFKKALHFFKQHEGEKLLILGEGLSMMRCLKSDPEELRDFNDWLTFLTSMGDSEGIHLWFITQTGNLKDLGLDSSVRACFDLLALMTEGNDALLQGLLRTDLMPSGKASNPKSVKDAIAMSPIGRAYYFNREGAWLPMPVLPNKCGYDRDSGQWLDDRQPVTVQTVQPQTAEPDVWDVMGNVIATRGFSQKTEQPGTISEDGKITPPTNPATHCGPILWAQLDKRMKAGDPTAFAAGKAIRDLWATDYNAALALTIKSTCKDRAQLEALCGTAYGFLWPS